MLTGRTSVAIGALSLGVLLAGGASCSSSDVPEPAVDGGESGGAAGSGGASSSGGKAQSGGAPGSGGKATGGRAGSGGSGTGVVVCGGKTCTTSSAGTGIDAYPCCTIDDTCGVKLPLSGTCLPRNQFGTVNDDCEAYVIPDLITMPGCCGTDGCGARATFENLGCISNANLEKPKVACNQDGTPADGG